jgi:hypothetical protein
LETWWKRERSEKSGRFLFLGKKQEKKKEINAEFAEKRAGRLINTI